ncbi:unnamed protein product [Amoebophrya sp. A25]|nr:unnamed protein product [Amoebophrya sp. A25]|eukprot:GSA25T00006391001.1
MSGSIHGPATRDSTSRPLLSKTRWSDLAGSASLTGSTTSTTFASAAGASSSTTTTAEVHELPAARAPEVEQEASTLLAERKSKDIPSNSHTEDAGLLSVKQELLSNLVIPENSAKTTLKIKQEEYRSNASDAATDQDGTTMEKMLDGKKPTSAGPSSRAASRTSTKSSSRNPTDNVKVEEGSTTGTGSASRARIKTRSTCTANIKVESSPSTSATDPAEDDDKTRLEDAAKRIVTFSEEEVWLRFSEKEQKIIKDAFEAGCFQKDIEKKSRVLREITKKGEEALAALEKQIKGVKRASARAERRNKMNSSAREEAEDRTELDENIEDCKMKIKKENNDPQPH